MLRVLIVAIVFVLIGCSKANDKANKDPFKGMTEKERKTALEHAITNASRKEEIQIQGYLKRHQIPAKKTPTGVHYYIYEQGQGESIQDGQNVVVDYVVTKINGDTLYTTQKNFEEFIVANSQKESGLHEAMKLLKPGAKAIIILPSHRAHGMSGDTDKIPPLTTIIYNITVKQVF